MTKDGTICDEKKRSVGFRSIKWKLCKGASPQADPWICSVNGRDIFLQGVNWTPLRVMFADLKEEQYRDMLQKYRLMGINMMRVWGGAFLEKECFYSICDEFGILVWQEFPLSSSGLDNTPSDNENIIARMEDIVEEYIERRHYHASLALWSGGNELYDTNNERPLDFSNKMLESIKRVVDNLDHFHRLLPASPSGPVIYNDPKHYGLGIQWDVHGPWSLPEEPFDQEMSNIIEYWRKSDALFHSEVGVPGASSADLIKRYSIPYAPLPITTYNQIWAQFSWWIENDAFKTEHSGREPDSIEEYVEWSQKRQSKSISIAFHEAKRRFPRCGGFFIWMGHDCFPCPANTSIIDYEGKLKPAAQQLSVIMNEKT
jgi:beta-mannosidase